MGSTRVQENAEDQGVRRQKEEPNKITKKENKKEEQTKRKNKKKNKKKKQKEKTTRQYRGKDDTGGWKDSSLTLRMTVLVGR